MSEQELRALLAMMANERLPIDLSGYGLSFRGVPQSNLPVEQQALAAPQFARAGAATETPAGSVGLSYGNEPGQQGARLTYENLLSGLLGVKGEVGEGYKKGSVSVSPTSDLTVSGSLTQDQFGNLVKALQAQYVRKLNEDLMLGLIGRAGTNPYVGLQMSGRF